MKVNVICDDGFQQVIQVSQYTIARQLCEEICKIRNNLKIVSAQPNECILSAADGGEYISSEAAVLTYVKETNGTIDLHVSGFKSKEAEIVRLYETIVARRGSLVVSSSSAINESSSSSSSSSSTKISTNNVQQCCKELITNIENVFEQSIDALSATNPVKNTTKGSAPKNSKTTLLLDAIGKLLC